MPTGPSTPEPAWRRLPAGLPRFLVHYSFGPPFRSLMDVSEGERAGILSRGWVANPRRYADPNYVRTRKAVENTMRAALVDAGGDPALVHPPYARLGRHPASEGKRRPATGGAFAVPLASLPIRRVSFTWGDSFLLDAEFRAHFGPAHPAVGVVYPLSAIAEVYERWGVADADTFVRDLEFQLWFRPEASDYFQLEPEGALGWR